MTRKTISPVPLGNVVAQGVGLVRAWGQWFVSLRDALNANAGQLGRADAGTAANRPSIYTSDDAGRLFLSTDTDGLAIWDGSKWVNFTGDSPGWQAWTPAVTPGGSMTVSSLSILDAKYLRLGAVVHYTMQLTFTLGGTASTSLTLTLPVTPVGSNSALIASAADFFSSAGSWSNAVALISTGSGQLVVLLNAGANFALGASQLVVSGSYRCQ